MAVEPGLPGSPCADVCKYQQAVSLVSWDTWTDRVRGMGGMGPRILAAGQTAGVAPAVLSCSF